MEKTTYIAEKVPMGCGTLFYPLVRTRPGPRPHGMVTSYNGGTSRSLHIFPQPFALRLPELKWVKAFLTRRMNVSSRPATLAFSSQMHANPRFPAHPLAVTSH